MLSTEIRINGNLIAYIHARRSLQTENFDEYIYNFEYYKPESGKIINGQVTHIRSDGLDDLIFNILKLVRKKKKLNLKKERRLKNE